MHSPKPENLGYFDIKADEFVYHVYMPIKMRISCDIRIPDHLQCYKPLIIAAMAGKLWYRDYVYLTVKKMYVQKGGTANRPGWHIDGYGTENDLNFIWSDCIPTEFCSGEFNLSDCHEKSLLEMEQQAEGKPIFTYPEKTLLCLNNKIVHRVGVCKETCLRTFVKISISKDRYDLAGNAHNHLFDYDWSLVERQGSRNHPIASK
jgi:hypothetical protein